MDLSPPREPAIASKLLHELEVLRKMHFDPCSEKSKRPLDPKSLLPFPGIAELLERVVRVKRSAMQQLRLRRLRHRANGTILLFELHRSLASWLLGQGWKTVTLRQSFQAHAARSIREGGQNSATEVWGPATSRRKDRLQLLW
jgi:hypothetical protein